MSCPSEWCASSRPPRGSGSGSGSGCASSSGSASPAPFRGRRGPRGSPGVRAAARRGRAAGGGRGHRARGCRSRQQPRRLDWPLSSRPPCRSRYKFSGSSGLGSGSIECASGFHSPGREAKKWKEGWSSREEQGAFRGRFLFLRN